MSKIITKNQLKLVIESTLKEYDEALGRHINVVRKMSPSEGKLPKIMSLIHDLVNLDFKAAKHSITNKEGFIKISYLFRELNLIGLILNRINNNACKGGNCLRGLDITDLKKPSFNELVEYGFDVDKIIKYLEDPDVLEYLENDAKLRFRMGELDSIIMFLEELKDQYDSIVRNESRSIKKGFKTTLKEADYKMENKDEIKLTKQHMDELHKEGHCMCDDKCLVYYEDIKSDDKKMSELMSKLSSEKMDCVVITKQQMDMLHNDGKCDCDNNVTLSYSEEMDNHMSENKEMCSECGNGMMVEGTCNECGYSMNMSEEGVDEGNEFTKELSDARKEGKATFTVDGKTYKVEPVEESTKELAESILNTFDTSLLTEDMDNFKKLINYRNK